MSFTIDLPESTSGFTIDVNPKKEVAPPSFSDRLLSSMAGRFMKGANSIVEGGAEMLPYSLGVVSGLGGAAPNPVSNFFFDESRRVRQMNKEGEAVYQGAKERSGVTGTDVARGLGTVTGGVALGLASPAVPASTAGRAAYGALMGGSAAAFSPTAEADDKRFADQKGFQTLAGAGFGAVATPAIGAVVDKAGPVIDKGIQSMRALIGKGPQPNQAQILEQLRFDLGRENIDLNTFPPAARQKIVDEVSAAMQQGRKLDGAAALRKLDMDQFGGGTQGQITRDPVQWNREFNLRQVENAGEPLVDQAMRVRTETGQRLSAYGGSTPTSSYEAGDTAMKSLLAKDAPLKGAVDQAYNMARSADGRYAPLNAGQFSRAANDALDEMQLGPLLPAQAKAYLNSVSTGEIPLNVNTASMLESRFSGMARDLASRGDKQGALAVQQVLKSLRATDLMDDAATAATKGGPDLLLGMSGRSTALDIPTQQPAASARDAFNEAKRIAAARFATHDRVPALKAALDGDVAPEQFVSKFVLGGKVADVAELARFLPEEGKKAVQDQMAKHLERAAFGNNLSKDGVMSVERYASALDRIGKEKLSAFFPEEVVDDLYRIARVNSYVNQQPAGVTPNRSGTAGAVANLLQRIQGVPVAVPVVRGLVNQSRAMSALSPQVPSEAIPVITPALRSLLSVVPVSGGVLSQ